MLSFMIRVSREATGWNFLVNQNLDVCKAKRDEKNTDYAAYSEVPHPNRSTR